VITSNSIIAPAQNTSGRRGHVGTQPVRPERLIRRDCLPPGVPLGQDLAANGNKGRIREPLPTGEDLFREDEVFWGWSAGAIQARRPSFRRMFFV